MISLAGSVRRFAASLAVGFTACNADNSSSLDLREIERIQLPNETPIVDAVLSEREGLVVLRSDGSVVFRRPDDMWVPVGPESVRFVGISLDSAGRARVLSADGCEHLVASESLTGEPRCWRLPTGASVVAAVRTISGEWGVLLKAGEDALRAVRLADVVDSDNDPPAAVTASGAATLSTGIRTRSLLFWTTESPYTVRAMLQGASDVSHRIAALPSEIDATYRLLRPLVIDDTFLLVFADLTDDIRWLVRLDSTFRVRGALRVATPLGFLSTSGGSRLVAISDLDEQELVVYCIKRGASWKGGGSGSAATCS